MRAIILICTDPIEQHPLRMQKIAIGVTADDAKEVIVGRTASIDIKRPRTDDRRMWDVVFGVYGFPAIARAR